MAISVAEPKTGSGALCGWLTHDRASGIAVSRPEAGGVVLEGRAEYGRLLIPAGQTAMGETLAIGYFDDLRDGLELYADTIARLYHIKVKKVPSGYMTWYHAKALDEKRMPVLAAWCEKNLKPYGLEFLQIDNGWQLANRDFTAADPKGAYPGGMKATAQAITHHGLTAGIWLTPFGWDYTRPVFAGHRDWFVKRADGSVYAVDWGGDCLDMTNPAARDFLRGVLSRISHDWGYKFFKLDGLWTGMAVKIVYGDPAYRPDNFGDAVFHDPAMTNVEAYRRGLKTAREGAGSEAYFLGCTVSQNMRTLAGSIGLVDGIRVGVDSNKTWAGILLNVNVATSVYYLHNRVWHNDPDVLYLDEQFTLDQVRAWASWLAVTGDMYMVSNWLPEVPAERLDVLKRTIPNHNLKARPVDLYESYPARVWQLRAGEGQKRRDVIAMFNWGDKPQEIAVSLRRLGLAAGHYAVLEYWSDALDYLDACPETTCGAGVPPAGAAGTAAPQEHGSGSLKATLPPRSCKVFAVRRVDHPVVAGTSRHVTQGIIDLVEETWADKSPAAGALRGTSRVIAGERYQIRTTAPAHWRSGTARLLAADQPAGVTIRTSGDGPTRGSSSPARWAKRWPGASITWNAWRRPPQSILARGRERPHDPREIPPACPVDR